jgi:hypothetical protein
LSYFFFLSTLFFGSKSLCPTHPHGRGERELEIKPYLLEKKNLHTFFGIL